MLSSVIIYPLQLHYVLSSIYIYLLLDTDSSLTRSLSVNLQVIFQVKDKMVYKYHTSTNTSKYPFFKQEERTCHVLQQQVAPAVRSFFCPPYTTKSECFHLTSSSWKCFWVSSSEVNHFPCALKLGVYLDPWALKTASPKAAAFIALWVLQRNCTQGVTFPIWDRYMSI